MTTSTEADAAAAALGEDAWLAQALRAAARGQAGSVDAFLHAAGPGVRLDGTRTTCRAHFVVCGRDGRPRVDELTDRLAAQVVDYCIPRSRIAEAIRSMQQDGSTLPFGRLEQEARSLFTSLTNSGEGGELLLYMLMETVLRIPQVLCKMPLKTSAEMHVHGADGVHALPKDDGGLALYWGESKLYAGVAEAVRECLDSLAGFLLGGPDVLRRDLLLMRDHSDLGDEALTRALRAFFDEDDVRSTRVEYRGACLVGFNHDDYPDARSQEDEVQERVAGVVEEWAQTVGRRVGLSKLTAVEIEVFCVPFPSVSEFRAAVAGALRR